MKKEVICKKCKKPIPIKSKALDRAQLAKEKGKEFELSCPQCKTTNRYHVNGVKAKKSLFQNLVVSLIIFSILSLSVFYVFKNYWFKSVMLVYMILSILGIPGIIYAIYNKQQNIAIKNFNRFRK